MRNNAPISKQVLLSLLAVFYFSGLFLQQKYVLAAATLFIGLPLVLSVFLPFLLQRLFTGVPAAEAIWQ